MRTYATVVMATAALLLTQRVYAADNKDPRSQLIAVAGEAKQLKSANPLGAKGKAIALIEKARGIELGENASVQHQMMKLSLLAELHTLNGDYDISNDNYRKAYSLMPNFGFYRSMVINMRLKGDQAQAKAVVEEYRKIVGKELPKQDQAARRQDLVQFVETALNEALPEQKANKANAGDDGK